MRAVMSALVVVALLILGIGVGVALIGDDQESATVVRIVDGDTLIIHIDGVDERVRLLNIDTPESQTDGAPMECLADEATAFLEERLPVGTAVTLEFDAERTDPYGRLLAAVFHDDRLVNAEIAERGLGVAVLFEPNRRFFDLVREAQKRAAVAKVGFYDPAIPCSMPAQAQAIVDELNANADVRPVTEAEASRMILDVNGAIARAERSWLALQALVGAVTSDDVDVAVANTIADAEIRRYQLEQTRAGFEAQETSEDVHPDTAGTELPNDGASGWASMPADSTRTPTTATTDPTTFTDADGGSGQTQTPGPKATPPGQTQTPGPRATPPGQTQQPGPNPTPPGATRGLSVQPTDPPSRAPRSGATSTPTAQPTDAVDSAVRDVEDAEKGKGKQPNRGRQNNP